MACRITVTRFARLSQSSSRSLRYGSPCPFVATTSPVRRNLPHFATLPQRDQQRRWHSNPASKSKVWDFDQVKSLTETPTQDRVLIDVREPSEYNAGYIPTAINIPIKSQPEALYLSADEFEDRFGFPKPAAEQEVVFYCKSGVRSSAAARLAEQVGYQKVGEYRGSWLDWEKQGGQKSG